MTRVTVVIREGPMGYLAAHAVENVPKHLRVTYLEPWQARSARIGDRAIMEYRQTLNGFQWIVAQVLS